MSGSEARTAFVFNPRYSLKMSNQAHLKLHLDTILPSVYSSVFVSSEFSCTCLLSNFMCLQTLAGCLLGFWSVLWSLTKSCVTVSFWKSFSRPAMLKICSVGSFVCDIYQSVRAVWTCTRSDLGCQVRPVNVLAQILTLLLPLWEKKIWKTLIFPFINTTTWVL